MAAATRWHYPPSHFQKYLLLLGTGQDVLSDEKHFILPDSFATLQIENSEPKTKSTLKRDHFIFRN